jgi:hypothetical protein
MSNEQDETLAGMIGEFLPSPVLGHAFTRAFVEAWRTGVTMQTDPFETFMQARPPLEQGWFDDVLLNAGKAEASGLPATAILQDFIRSFWSDYLRRKRGFLPAAGGEETERERMRLSVALKQLQLVRWSVVKEMIREWMREL